MGHYYTVKTKCGICEKPFLAERWRFNKGLARFCGIDCANRWKKGRPFVLKKKHPQWSKYWLGKHHSLVTRKKISDARKKQIIPAEIYIQNGLKKRDEKHFAWKGNRAGYRAKHIWVETRLGKPDTCEGCGRTGLKAQQIHWSNKSKEYLRKLSDWQRLCASCHWHYDHA